MKSFVAALSLFAMVAGVDAFAADSRNCATLDQVKLQAEMEVVAPHQRANGVACVSQSVRFSVGQVVRDTYELVYACKAASAGAKVTLVQVSFRDARNRTFGCSELRDFTMTTAVEPTAREF